MGLLGTLESALRRVIEVSPSLRDDDVQPLDLVRQIEQQIEKNKKVFVNDRTLIPHRMVIHLYAPTPTKVEEYEALFNNADFQGYLEGYVKDRGFELLDRVRIEIRCHREPLPEFGKRRCFVEFSWPQLPADPGEITVVFDPEDQGRISSVRTGRSEVLDEAWLEVLEGQALETRSQITRREFNIGRTQHVFHRSTDKLLWINHLAFERPVGDDAINRSVSRQHARVVHQDGRFVLYDTGSQNGTSVHRKSEVILVPRHTPRSDGVALEHDDTLCFGRCRVRFTVGATPG